MTTKMAEQPTETPSQAEDQTISEAPAGDDAAAAPTSEETPAEQQENVEAEQEAEAPPPPTEGEGDQNPEPEAAPAEEEAAADAPTEAPVEGEAAGGGDSEAAQAAEGSETAQEGAPTDDAAPAVEGEGEAPAMTEGEPAADGEPQPEGDDAQPKTEGEEGDAAEGSAPVTGEEVAPGEEKAEEGEGTAAEDAEAAPVEGGAEGGEEQREGSPIVVGEQLSREGSPTQDAEDQRIESPPVPGSPEVSHIEHQPDDYGTETRHIIRDGTGSLKEADEDEMEEEDDEEEEEEEEMEPEPEYDRDQLIEQYHQALAEREQQLQQNYQLQHKLAEHFRKKKSEDTRQEVDKNVTDSEQRYVKYMAQLDDLRNQDADERATYKQQIEELKERCQARQALVEDEQAKFMEFQKQVALNSLNSRSGKPIPPKDIEQYLVVEGRKEAEVVNVRLENIKLNHKIKKAEQQMKSKEELAEGLHLIDFEQLKIENQTYNEKIEERNEDLLKLRKKITSTVQVLTHLKEKLQFVHAENQVLKHKLHEVEEEAAKKRDKLTRTKQARDQLRIDNHRLRHNCGLLGNEPLLRDFEERKDESEDLRNKLEDLKIKHAELTLSCNGVRKKIEQARVGRP